ncbi:MAG: phosphatase PAP2 family protein [Leptospira sp.]|nr:phosphatase PAP2 family protein [Leptospira sp.]
MNKDIFRKYFLIMAGFYTLWVCAYFTTLYIGSLRGEAFRADLPIDEKIPFVPEFFPIYLLCYFTTLGMFLVSLEAEFLNRGYVIHIYTNLCAFIFFILFPVQGPDRSFFVSDGSFLQNFVAFFYSVDDRYNALPSLHVANPFLLVFLSFGKTGLSKRSMAFLFLAIMISLATMFVKQHYFYDVMAGLFVASLGYTLFGRIRVSKDYW